MNQDTKRYLEIRHRKMWKQLFTEGLDTYTNEVVKTAILNGQDHHIPESTSETFSAWICGAMERLEAFVQDKETRRKIMLCCSSRIPVDHLQLLREVYQQTGDLNCLIAFMNKDLSRYRLSYSEKLIRDGNRIYVTKQPRKPQANQATNIQAEKHTSDCHCPHIRPALLCQKPISPSYCLCGSGWYKHLWEELLNQPVTVEMLETITSGADHCRFVIHLLEEPVQRRCGSDCTLHLRSDNPKERIDTIH
jgi:hypothetical protein